MCLLGWNGGKGIEEGNENLLTDSVWTKLDSCVILGISKILHISFSKNTEETKHQRSFMVQALCRVQITETMNMII